MLGLRQDEMEEIKRLRQGAILSVLDFKVEHLPDSGWEISVLMEHADRGSLGERLADDGPLPVARVRSWTIELLEALDLALGGFAADGHGEGVGAQFVDLVVLGEARLAAAVEYIVELFAALAVEYARKGTCCVCQSAPCSVRWQRGTHVLARHQPA